MAKNKFKGIVVLSRDKYNSLETKEEGTLYVKNQFVDTPEKVSELENDSKFLNQEGIENASLDLKNTPKVNGKDIALKEEIPQVVTNLETDSNTRPLAASQGVVLNQKISNVIATMHGKNNAFTVTTLLELCLLFGIETGGEAQESYKVPTNVITYKDKEYTLKNGDVFYLVRTDAPDYWFSSDDMTLYAMETRKVDLSEYALITYVDSENENQNKEIEKKANDADLKEVAKTGSYNDLIDKPTDLATQTYVSENYLPKGTKVGDLENDVKYATEDYVGKNGGKIDSIVFNGETQEIVDKVVTLTSPKETFGAKKEISGKDLNTIIEQGNYGIASDCTNLPIVLPGTLFVGISEKGNYPQQTFIDNADGMWIRNSTSLDNSTWSEWKKLTNTKDLKKVEDSIPEFLSELTDDATHRLVTDVEKETWNKKAGLQTENGEIFNNYTNNIATGGFSHAEGNKNEASGLVSHAEGSENFATGDITHVEGINNKAIGDYSHAEGQGNEAEGIGSHAEGILTKAIGASSHTNGYFTIADQNCQTAIGIANEENKVGALFSVGNGIVDDEMNVTERKTVFEVFQDGKVKKNNIEIATINDIPDVSGFATQTFVDEIARTKVDKDGNKVLSTNDFTNEDKEKLDELENYNDTEIKDSISTKADKTEVNAIDTRVGTIESHMPSNIGVGKLASESFVNSSVSTATATFRGTHDTLEELQLQSADENDYGFVRSTDELGNKVFQRYKYTKNVWEYEYDLNNSSFTQAQWDAINSGISSGLVEQIMTNKNDIVTLNNTKADKFTIDVALNELSSNPIANSAVTPQINSLNNQYTSLKDRLDAMGDNITEITGGNLYDLDQGIYRIKYEYGYTTRVNYNDGGYTILEQGSYIFIMDAAYPSGSGAGSVKSKTYYIFSGNNSYSGIQYGRADAIEGTNNKLYFQADASLNTTSEKPVQNKVIKAALTTLENKIPTTAKQAEWDAKSDFSGSYNDLNDKPTLFSGAYDDLTGKPTIPTVNNGTLTIQKNGESVGTFTANQSGNTTANLTFGDAADKDVVTSIDTSASLPTSNAVKTYVDAEIDAIVGEGASQALDTIGEIAKAIEDNKDIIDTLNEAIGSKADNSDIETLQENINRVEAKIPTDNSQLANGKGYLTSSDTITNAINATNATKAVQDNDGNIIVDTYATKKELNVVENKIPTGEASTKDVATSITGSENLPTDKAVKDFVEGKNYLTGINSTQITTALGYTPYNSTNPDGYLTKEGTIDNAINATKLNNQDASYYLNYNNFTNKPTIPSISGLASQSDLDTTNTNLTNLEKSLGDLAFVDDLSKGDVGLGNVDNTSDANKPISTATQKALNLKANTADLGSLAYKDSLTASDVGALPSDTEIPSISGLASETYVNQKIADLVNGAPGTLDTLDELAAALKDNASIVDTLNDAIASKANKDEGIYFVDGTGNTTAGTWEGTNSRITSYYDGLTINFKVGVAGVSGGTKLNINSLGAKPCYLRGTTKVTTQYTVGTMVIFTYNATTDAFYSSDYDANSSVKQSPKTTNGDFPILLRGTSAGTTETTTSTSFGTTMTANPSTGNISATSFTEDGTSLSAKYLSFDGGTLNYQGQIKAGTSLFKDLYVEAENLRVLNPKNEDTTPTKIATIDSTGYIKYRTPSEIKNAIGLGDVGAASRLGVDTTIGDSPTDTSVPTSQAVKEYIESKGLANETDLEATYMKKSNPNGTGSLSLNRKADSTAGANSTTVGYNNTASGTYSMAQGHENEALGWASHAEGAGTLASGYYAHAEGVGTIARGEGSHAEGEYTTATHQSQHVFGEYNALDTSTATKDERGTYIEIVGNGTSDTARANARTLDWSGNEVLSGTVTATGFKIPSGTSTQVLRADGGATTIGAAASKNVATSLTSSTNLPTDLAVVSYISNNCIRTSGGTIEASKTLTMGGTSNTTGAKIQWGTVGSNTPYIGFASDQSDGTFMVGSLKGTNYQSGLAIGGGSGNLLWKGTKVATTSDIPTKTSQITNDSGFITSSSLPSELVKSEDYSQSSDVNNALVNYVTKSELLDLTHPVNSIYISINSTSPSQLFGGTWVELPAGSALWTTATASGDAGGTIAAGLPNITGSWTSGWNVVARGFHNLTTSGAFYDSYGAGLHDGTGRIQGVDDNNTGTRGYPWFDASRSNAIYGNSSTVQPPAYKVYAWRRTA